MPLKYVLLLFSVYALISPSVATAQVIDTNRPGFSYSPNVVAPGQWQLETGFSYTRSNDGARTTSLPLAELRTGVADQVEVFVSSMSWSRTDSSSGLVDMALGTKISISDAENRTQMALVFLLSAPTGDSDFSSDRWDPGIGFVWAHSGALPVAGTVLVTQYDSGFQLGNSFKLPHSWNDAHSTFVEWEANLPEHGSDTHWLNGGYQWLLDDHMQLDFSAGLGLNDAADDYRFGVGFSIAL